MTRTRVRVPMRDGIQLATDIYAASAQLLNGGAARPVMLERTPYGISDMRPSDGLHADKLPVSPESGARYFVDEGYIVVRQDCRGRGDSEGKFSKYVGEANDGVDTHAWILRQPWCDGRIITSGVSYSAHTQAASASAGAEGIAAMILDSGGFSSAYETGGRFGGAFELKQATWAYRHAIKSPEAAADPVLASNLRSQNLAAWFTAMPWQEGLSPLAASPEYEEFLFTQWRHESLDDYWKQPGMFARGFYEKFPDAPSLHISSWYDPYVLTAVENFHALGERKRSPAFLLLGPWTHGARSQSHSGDVDFGPEAALDGNLASDYLEYKAQWLRDCTTPEPNTAMMARPAVSYFLMGGGPGTRNEAGHMQHGGHWEHDSQWPPVKSRPQVLHFGSAGALASAPEDSGESVSYDFDPRHPVPSVGGAITSGEPLMVGGAFNQTPTDSTFPATNLLPLSSRSDVLTFRTTALTEDLAVAGPLTLHLQISSSAPDTDFAVKLIDEYPPNADYPSGYAVNISDGMLRCRYRNGFERPQLMVPGEIYDLQIPIPDTANSFVSGHRLRLDITSSNFPRCDVNPNTGKPVAGDRTWQIARNTIHIDGSRLAFHVLPG
ncbi:MAG: CocE/NonD family hydrolase [Specibacter sp.]